MSPPRRQRAPRPPRESKEGHYDRDWERAARWMLARGVHPNHFTLLQIPVLALQITAALQQWRWTFVLLILFVIVLDGGDGILARVGKLQSKSGAVLDALFDTIGITVVLLGAIRFEPSAKVWLIALLAGNFVLLVQNALLEQKALGYLRGPVLIGVAVPATMLGGLAIASVTLAWLFVTRLPQTWKALNYRVGLA